MAPNPATSKTFLKQESIGTSDWRFGIGLASPAAVRPRPQLARLWQGCSELVVIAKGNVAFDFEWEGPGFERRQLTMAELFHLPDVLAAYKEEFETQKTMR